jgi:hypothetical protein
MGMRALSMIGLVVVLAGCGTAPAMTAAGTGALDIPPGFADRLPVRPAAGRMEMFQQIIGTPSAHHLLDGAG